MLAGLTNEEAGRRLKIGGPNTVASGRQQSYFLSFLNQFKSPLVLMLIVASVISFFSGSYTSASLIFLIVFISSGINFFVSYKSEKSAQALLNKVALKTTVVRDGKEESILVSEVVVGDIVMIEAGNIIPADGIVRDGHDLFVNESSLTGESLPIEKNIGDSVYLGSGVVTGHVYIEITATGQATKFFSIVSMLAERERTGEFERGIKDFSFLIAKVVVIMTVIVFLVNAFLKHDLLESFIFSLAIAVGITPELLPMIIALNISRSSIKMAKHGVIVKKLSAVENFGSMDILCTDKTGTLTEDKITLVKYLDINGRDSVSVLEYAFMSSFFHTGTKSPLDGAIAEYENFDLSLYKKVDETTFDFERRRDSLTVEYDNKHILVVKGAPEQIFQVSKISAKEKILAEKLFDSLSQDGYRVLAVATKEFDNSRETYNIADEIGLTFQGFIAFIDPAKHGVGKVLEELRSRGINIKIITGDNMLVAEKIARDVGLEILGKMNTEEIETLTDIQLAELAEETTIFARVNPGQKNRIIKSLQSLGHVVGYMGDGINDAPALRTSDVGISVSNAVDVAKEAADIILLKKSFRQLIDGVVEGRRTFANTIKYISMAISSNFGNMFSMTGASFLLPFLPMLPAQILFNNLLYDGSQSAITFDRVEESVLSRPNPWSISFIKRFMLVFGGISSIFDFLTFFVLYKVFMLSGSAFQTGWFIESFATQTLVIFLIRSRKSIFKALAPHPLVTCATFLAVVAAWFVALTELGSIFGFTPLPLPIVLSIVGIVLLYLIIVEITKSIFFRKMLAPVKILKV